MISTLYFLLLLSPFLLSEKPKCKIVLEEQVQCQPRVSQDDCIPGCRTETLEECRQVVPEDCTTEYETKCESPKEEVDDSRRRKRSLVPIGLSGLGLAKLTALKLMVAKVLKSKHSSHGPHAATIAALHTADTALDGAVNVADATLDSVVRMGEAKIHGVEGVARASVDGIFRFADATLDSVRKVGGATIAGVANLGDAALDGGHLVAESKLGHRLSDVCFQIPRTVCDYRRSSSQGLERNGNECSTTVQTVCGVDSRLVDPRHRRRRSVEMDGEGCVKVPVSQMCTKRKEVETVCETVDKQVCTDCKESTVCTPKKVQREVCEDKM